LNFDTVISIHKPIRKATYIEHRKYYLII